jgi:hypothetical protein
MVPAVTTGLPGVSTRRPLVEQLQAITIDNADVTAMRTINPSVMPTIFRRIAAALVIMGV